MRADEYIEIASAIKQLRDGAKVKADMPDCPVDRRHEHISRAEAYQDCLEIVLNIAMRMNDR